MKTSKFLNFILIIGALSFSFYQAGFYGLFIVGFFLLGFLRMIFTILEEEYDFRAIISGLMITIGLGFVILAFIDNKYLNNKIFDDNSSYSSKKFYGESSSSTKKDKENKENKENNKLISKYHKNQLSNGDTPFNTCFGTGTFWGNAELFVDNGSNTDAIVCLYDLELRSVLRHAYVRKNNEFKINKIKQGKYKIKVFYGNDWNPNLTNDCGGLGNFEIDGSFSEFDGINYFQDNTLGYTSAHITLYTIPGGNVTTSPINSKRFFQTK